MAKQRVTTRLKESLGKKSHYKSEDLVKLSQQYETFCKRLKSLIEGLQAHYASQAGLAKTRLLVAKRLALLAQDTPLFEHVGQLPGADRSTDSVCSYLSVHDGLGNKANMYCSKYKQFVVDYAVEWERVITSRVGEGLKKAESLRVEVDHYQNKVEGLRLSANKVMAKGKQIDGKTSERLTRNEEKLIQVKQKHSKFTSDLCILIEEVTERSWRDLHPLLIKVTQFDVTLSGDEAKAMSGLNTVVNELKRLAVTHGIKPQARLKDLDQLDPTKLSTRKPEPGQLAIEGGFAGISLGGSEGALSPSSGGLGSPLSFSGESNDMKFPPGSVAPQGMGGFPVTVQSSNIDPYAPTGSSTPSTLDMVKISGSAAPPPNYDTLSAAFGPSSGGSIQSAPIGLGTRGRIRSTDSFDSAFSGLSGTSAPPPAAPPPPPPTQFGQALVPNPFGGPPSAPSSYGAPPQGQYPTQNSNQYGLPPPAPAPGNYGAPSPLSLYGAPAPASYGAPSPGSYGAPAPGYGAPPQQYGGQQQQQQYGAPPPQQYGAPSLYGQQNNPNNPHNPFG